MKGGTRSSFSAMTGCSRYGSSWRLARSRCRERHCRCPECRKRSAFQSSTPRARPFWRSRERGILTDAGITTLSPPPISEAVDGSTSVSSRLLREISVTPRTAEEASDIIQIVMVLQSIRPPETKNGGRHRRSPTTSLASMTETRDRAPAFERARSSVLLVPDIQLDGRTRLSRMNRARVF
jgi:hypothetical protein